MSLGNAKGKSYFDKWVFGRSILLILNTSEFTLVLEKFYYLCGFLLTLTLVLLPTTIKQYLTVRESTDVKLKYAWTDQLENGRDNHNCMFLIERDLYIDDTFKNHYLHGKWIKISIWKMHNTTEYILFLQQSKNIFLEKWEQDIIFNS